MLSTLFVKQSINYHYILNYNLSKKPSDFHKQEGHLSNLNNNLNLGSSEPYNHYELKSVVSLNGLNRLLPRILREGNI